MNQCCHLSPCVSSYRRPTRDGYQRNCSVGANLHTFLYIGLIIILHQSVGNVSWRYAALHIFRSISAIFSPRAFRASAFMRSAPNPFLDSIALTAFCTSSIENDIPTSPGMLSGMLSSASSDRVKMFQSIFPSISTPQTKELFLGLRHHLLQP